jgi:acyl carrier protein
MILHRISFGIAPGKSASRNVAYRQELSMLRGVPVKYSKQSGNQPMKTLEQTTDEILTLAATHFKVPRAGLDAVDDFYKKLGIDSLQALELLTRLENHFGVELPDYEVQGVSNFRTLAERIQARL